MEKGGIKMKPRILYSLVSIIVLILVISGCGSQQTSTPPTEEQIETADTQPTEVAKSIPQEESEVVVKEEPKPEPITEEIANSRYELDPEMGQYPQGQFEFKDGTTVTANLTHYLDGETFYYASAIFEKGKLANVQLELKENVSKDEVLAEWGLSENVRYDEGRFGNIVDIVVDERFADENIHRLPNEWD